MRLLSNSEYRKLCKEIYRVFIKPVNLGYWEACDLADSVNCGETTKARLWEFLLESALENGEPVNI